MKLNEIATRFKKEFEVYRFVAKHNRTPLLAKLLLGLAIGYILMPFDLIPDWIPILGHVDDIIIIPLLVYAALALVPKDVIAECRGMVP
jgi:uncharacterized membrane protein YkvA (DUF1232 family)